MESRMSTISPQYYIQPPSLPRFIYGTSNKAWVELMVWSYKEYQERLKQLPKRGYYKELTYQARSYSPIRVLAEMQGFRGICAMLQRNPRVWNNFNARQRQYIRKAFQLRDHLMRSGALVH
jgi:hypothetical protein